MDANQCSSRMDPDHPGSPSSLSPVAQCASGGTEAQSVSRFEAGAPAVSFKGGPVDVEDHEARDCVEGVGAGTVEARTCLEEVLKKAKTEGSTESRDATSRPPEASLAEANAKMVLLQGSLAALGPDDVAERRVLEDALAKVRARAIVAPIGQRLDRVREVLRAGGRSESRRLRKQWPKH